ncbi:MAG: hypothetical protein ACLUR5_18195 [Eubacterium ventriosum]
MTRYTRGEGNQDVSSLTDGIVSDNNGVCVHTEHGAQDGNNQYGPWRKLSNF